MERDLRMLEKLGLRSTDLWLKTKTQPMFPAEINIKKKLVPIPLTNYSKNSNQGNGHTLHPKCPEAVPTSVITPTNVARSVVDRISTGV